MSIAIAPHVFHHNGQPGTAPSERANAAGGLATSFAAVEQSVDADVGLVVAPVGRTGTVYVISDIRNALYKLTPPTR